MLLRCLTWRRLCAEYSRAEQAHSAGNFPKSVCTSVNECICHGIPDARKLVDGDIVNIDVTVYLNVRLLVFLQHCLLWCYPYQVCLGWQHFKGMDSGACV